MKLFCNSKKKNNKQKIINYTLEQKEKKSNFLNFLKSKGRQKFIGHTFKNQKYFIGINIIPSGNIYKFFTKYNPFIRLFTNKNFDLNLFPDLLCGHTSIISFGKYGVLNNKYSIGYAPNFFDSIKIYLCKILGYSINVPGIIYEENNSIIGDQLSIQIITSIHYNTYILFNKLIGNTGRMGNFSFTPKSGF